MSELRVYSAAETAALLPYGAVADEIAAVMLEFARGAAVAGADDALRVGAADAASVRVPERTVLELPAGTLLTMPASDARLSIVKVVTVHPGNAGSALPTISGEVIVADAGDGRRLGLLHGATVTVRRTAALSLLAVRTLRQQGWGPRRGGSLLVIGAGAQGRGHAEALAREPGVTRVLVAARTEPRAAALARDLNLVGIDADVVPTDGPEFDEALAEAALVVTATTSRRPVVSGGLRPDAIVCAVGAYRHDMAELSTAVVGGAGLVVVDTRHGARAEAGELIAAADAGAWRWVDAVALADLLAAPVRPAHDRSVLDRQAPDRPAPSTAADLTARPLAPAGYAVFKSVGHALYDLAAARVAFPARNDS